ncbi:MAG: EAL domain-containing protein [Actinomycetota bacterium]|nr:EAL domain-containing protein [Actinomycetota bacterium]
MVLRHSADAAMLLHPERGVVYASPAMAHVLGTPSEQFLGKYAGHWVHPDDVDVAIEQRHLATLHGHSGPVELRGRHGDGTYHWFEAEWWHVEDDHTVLHLREVGTTRATREALERHDARLHALLRDSSEIVLILDPTGRRLTYIGASTERILGWSASDRGANHWPDLVHPDDLDRVVAELDQALAQPGSSFRATVRTRHRNGSWLVLEMTATNLSADPLIGGVVVHAHDITRSHQLQQELARRALTDELTGLPNRALFLDRVDLALQRRRHHNDEVAVLLCGIDRFTSIVDAWGHESGDTVIKEIGTRLQRLARRGDTVASVAGDEYAICLERTTGRSAITTFAQRVLDAVTEPISIDGRVLRVTGRLGVAVAPTQAEPDGLLRDASAALHLAKGSGLQRVAWFDHRVRSSVLDRLEMADALRHAIAADEMVLHYQPTYDTVTGVMAAVEALVRWQHPVRGLLSPDEFIPEAEVSGAILELGGWVLRTATQAAVTAGFHTHTPARVMWVNVSARQLAAAGIVEQVTEALNAAGLPPACLGLEITETVLLDADSGFAERIAQLRRLGCHIAIDDFGTGYASLTYLHRYEVDVLKIDRSFVAGLEAGGHDASIVAAVNGLGLSLNLKVTAEGVETLQQLDLLCEIGCPSVSGFALCKPIPANELADVLDHTLDDRRSIFNAARS